MRLPAKSPAFLGTAVIISRKHIKGFEKTILLYILYTGKFTEAIAIETSFRYC